MRNLPVNTKSGKKTSRSEQSGIRFTSTLERSDNKLWGAHFEVPKRVATKLIKGQDRRVICRLNGEAEYQCALLPHGNGSFVITVNKKLRDKLHLKPGSEVEVSLQKDDSAYGLPMPEEMREVLRQDSRANKLFHALTPGKQRTLLYIVGNVKDPDRRIMRSIAIAEHLKANDGMIRYKQLSEAMKSSRM